jgi:hypothetical protein
MQVPYGEGVACHTGLVACATDREVSGEALVRGNRGLGIEPRKRTFERRPGG